MPNLEQLSDAEIDKMLTQKMLKASPPLSPQAPVISNDISDADLDKLVFEKMAKNPQQNFGNNQPILDSENEADLGFINRAKYAIEPLESNRRELLVQEFGAENVTEDKEGNLYLNQNGKIKPVNKEGFSVADVADFAGATPEMLGAGVGAIAGVGVASIPGLAAGGAAGSVVRQGLSAAVGNPQVATPIERATEIAMSSGFSALGGAGGKVIKHGAKKMAPIFKKAFSSFNLSNEGKRLAKIALKQGIPVPTSGQLAGGRDLMLEKALAERPIFGAAIRKQTAKQTKVIKTNIAKQFGEFVDSESGRDMAGMKVKGIAHETIKTIKKQSSELFDKVSEEGRDVFVEAKGFKKEVLKGFSKIGLFDHDGGPLRHTSRTGLTEDQFKRVQGIFGKVLNDIDGSAGRHGKDQLVNGVSSIGHLDATTINTMRKFIDANIDEGGKQGLDNVLLIKLKNSFLDVTETMLGEKDKALKGEFRKARSLWAEQLKLKRMFEKGGKNGLGFKDMSDEKVVKHLFSSKKNVQMLKEVVGDDAAKEAGVSYINDMLIKKLGSEDQVGAGAILTLIKEKSEAITEAIGKDSYKKLNDNLFFLEKIGRPVNPSRTAITQIMTDLTPGGFASGAAQQAVRKTREASRSVVKGAMKATRRLPQRGSRALNLISDSTQREAAFFAKGPAMIAEDKKPTSKKLKRLSSLSPSVARSISSKINKGVLKGRAKWTVDGIDNLINIDSQKFNSKNIEKLYKSKKGEQLLIEASSLKPNSKAMKSLLLKIDEQLNEVQK